MRKVITVNLNNNAYPVEDAGYDALQAYLATAEARLAANPDSQEILADLEQAIADKCDTFLGAHKNLITTAEVEQILKAMGPVEVGAEPAQATGGGAAAEARSTPEAASADRGGPKPRSGPRRLYRIAEKKMIAGVCTGLAAYFGVDVVWIRLLFVLLALLTGGGLLIYLALLFIVPRAETAEELAAAHGEQFNAQELVDRAKKKYEQYRAGSVKRRARRDGEGRGPRPGYAARITGGLLLPVFTVLSAALFVALLLCLATLLGHHWAAGGGFMPQLPFWAVIVALFVLYLLLGLPVGAGRRTALYYANGGRRRGWAELWSGLLWLAVAAALLLAAYGLVPGLQAWLLQRSSGLHGVSI